MPYKGAYQVGMEKVVNLVCLLRSPNVCLGGTKVIEQKPNSVFFVTSRDITPE
jgi:hypothetical protein